MVPRPEDARYFLSSELRKIRGRADRTLKALAQFPPNLDPEGWEGTYLNLQEVADDLEHLLREVRKLLPKP